MSKKMKSKEKIIERWDDTVERTNFWELFRLQLKLSTQSAIFGVCIMLLVGLSTSDIIRNKCAYVTEQEYSDWTIMKEAFLSCALNHWSAMFYRPVLSFWFMLTTYIVWQKYMWKSKSEQAIVYVIGLLAVGQGLYMTFTSAKYQTWINGTPTGIWGSANTFGTFWSFCLIQGSLVFALFKMFRRKVVRKGSGLIVLACIFGEIGGYFVYSTALESILNKSTPVWQVIAFRYLFHEIFWGFILWGYRIFIRNCIGLEVGAEALLLVKVIASKAIFARFLLVQLKGFGQIIAINLFDAIMTFFMRALYVIYDEWFMQLQYGNRASKAIIATAEENHLRTFEAQAETLTSAPSVFVTGGLLLLGHFQPITGELVNHTKVIMDIVVQLVTNFISDWVSLRQPTTSIRF